MKSLLTTTIWIVVILLFSSYGYESRGRNLHPDQACIIQVAEPKFELKGCSKDHSARDWNTVFCCSLQTTRGLIFLTDSNLSALLSP